MSMTSTLPRRPTLMTIPALENSAMEARISGPDATSPTHAPSIDEKTGPFFYAILSFIILALVLGVFPPS